MHVIAGDYIFVVWFRELLVQVEFRDECFDVLATGAVRALLNRDRDAARKVSSRVNCHTPSNDTEGS